MSEADTLFEKLAARYVDEAPALSPVSATGLGDHRFDGELDDVSADAIARKATFCREYIDKLGRIRRSELSPANRIDAARLEHGRRAALWHLEELREWAWNPTSYAGLVGSAVYGLMARDFAPLGERLMNAARRLEEFPRLLEQVRAILEPPRVPRVHAETAVAQNRGVVTIINETIVPHVETLPPADRSRLTRAVETARAAVEEHQRWLEEDLLPKAGGDFRLGGELYDRKLAFALDTPLTREEVRKRAEDELRRVREEMYEIARGLYSRKHPHTRFPPAPSESYRQAIVRACLETACVETPEPAGIVAAAKESLARLTAFVREADLVTAPDDPVEVIVMPEFRRGKALAYCDSPGPLDAGERTFYAISPPPAAWTEEQVGSLLREYNLRSLANLTVHEAMPGHYLQLTLSNRHPSTLRAMLASGVFVEGWAVYAERMMVEEGAYEEDELMHLVVLKWRLRAIANAVLDQAIHVDGMTEHEAMALMMEDTFQEEREAAGKWVRAQLTSAQLPTYFVGYLEHSALRRDVERAWGDGFTLKKYHDTILSHGSPPPRYVRELVLGPNGGATKGM
jgi:uncharacterized protein (DUF885 family)